MRPGPRLWAMAAAVGGVLAVVGPTGSGVAQITLPTTTSDQTPSTTTPPNTAPPVTSPPLRPTTTAEFIGEVSTSIERRATTTTTEPPTTTLATIAPPAGAGNVVDTTPPERTRPGQGNMPAWPYWLFGLGAGGSVSIMAGQYVRTRPRR